jgi:hypothetical protein
MEGADHFSSWKAEDHLGKLRSREESQNLPHSVKQQQLEEQEDLYEEMQS